mmetsp:Transcript_23258/g.64570  ORF Transcript_23258/g.64570 Transcript_23258/m.64570 type:complete len:201 (+) Transcript_23258:270-872(+)
MDWLQRTLGEWGSAEFPEGNSSLQRSGMLSKEQLERFYKDGYQLFDHKDFMDSLKLAHSQGKDLSAIINDAQKEIFEKLGVQGDFGIACLSRVTSEYSRDPSAIQKFMEFAQREEMVLDEVELPPDQFEKKKTVFQKQQEMTAQLRHMSSEEREKLLNDQQKMLQHLHEMTEEERQLFLATSKVTASSIMHEMGGLSQLV